MHPAKLLPPFLVALTALLLIMPAVGSVMHESDQASLLKGAFLLSEGGNLFAADFYNYDKQFFSYWLLAGLFAFLRLFLASPDYVFWGNVASSVGFWSSLVLLAARAPRRLPATVALLTAVLAPSLLIHSPFLATNYLSGAFLIFAYLALAGGRGPAAVICAFAAVGCRADAVLLLPWILWLTARPREVQALVLRPLPWFVVGAGLAAAVLGKFIFTLPPIDAYAPWVTPKVFVVYTAAGLGACGLLYLLVGIRIAAGALSGRRRLSRLLFTGSGLLALALPASFYAIQLFSTRHWTLTVLACVVFAASRRGAALLPAILGRPLGAIPLGALALLPVFVGLSLPALTRPSLTFRDPICFPSADGYVPLGAIWEFNRGSADRCPGVRDHNQSTWLAARTADFRVSSRGYVQILQENSLATILELAATLQRKPARVLFAPATDFASPAYTDWRHLLRDTPDWSSGKFSEKPRFLDEYAIQPVSARECGSQIVAVQNSAIRDPHQAILADLAEAFSQNEFSLPRILPAAKVPAAREYARQRGRAAVLMSDQAFQLAGNAADFPSLAAQPTHRGHWFVFLDPKSPGIGLPRGDGPWWFAESTLPTYMSIQAYQNATRILVPPSDPEAETNP